MADVSPPADAESYELLTADACQRGLPVNPIRDHYTIARFVDLSILVDSPGSGQPAVTAPAVRAVIPRDVVFPGLAEAYAQANPGATLTDMKGGAALVNEWNKPIAAPAAVAEPPLARPVFVADIDELIATKLLDIEGEQAKVRLDRTAISSLLEMGRAVVPVEANGKRELISITTKPATAAPSDNENGVEVSDLAAFLEQPLVVTPDGTLEETELSAENVTELRETGTTQVSSGLELIELAHQAHIGGSKGVVELLPAGEATLLAEPIAPQPALWSFKQRMAAAFPAYELSLYLPFHQTWELLGYSRGALLNSLSLAPQEETTIEVFSWDRRKRSTDRTTTTDLDVTTDVSLTTKDSDEVISEMTNDSSFQAKLGGELSVAAIGLTIGGSTDTKSAVKEVAKATHNHIEDSVVKTSAKVKASRQTKISVTTEFGREERITRKVRNPNMCHALTLDYFEVLANYVVRTAFDASAARLCVLLDNPLDFTPDRQLLRVYEDVLRPALLAPSLVAGFDAAKLLAARERACAVACEACDCSPGMPGAEEGNAAATAAWQAVRASLGRLSRPPISLLTRYGPDYLYNTVSAGSGAANHYEAARDQFQQWLYVAALTEAGAGALVGRLSQLARNPALADEKWFVDDLWSQVRSLPDGVLNTKELHAAQKDALWQGWVSPSLRTWSQINSKDLWGVSQSAHRLTFNERLEDAGLPSALSGFKAAYNAYEAALASLGKSRDKVSEAALARDQEATSAIADTYPLQEVTEAQEREDALIKHIETNKPYYRFALWRSLDAAAQRRQLSSAPGIFGRLIAPEAVGFYGDRLAFPVALSAHEELKQWFTSNLANNAEVTAIAGERPVSLPTPGIAVESRLGQCDACEDFIREQRAIELRTRAAQAAKEEREAERYAQRLRNQPPVLDDPKRPDGPVRIELDQRARQT